MRLLAVAVVVTGCTSDPVCSPEIATWQHASRACGVAVLFAARDSADLVPTSSEIDLYLDHWQRALDAEPVLRLTGVQRYRGTGMSAAVTTTNPVVIAAWRAGQLVTGETELDATLAALAPSAVARSFTDNGNGTFLFSIEATVLGNEERLQDRLTGARVSLSEPVIHGAGDALWHWDGAIARIDVKLGWVDCIAGCGAFHQLQAIVPPRGAATVFDLGGEPMPWPLQPTTLPP